MELATEKLVQARLQPNTVLDDDMYTQNVRDWVANQLDQRGYVGPVSYETKRVRELKDAISNRNFQSLRSSRAVVGLGLNQTGHTGIQPPEFDLIEQAAVYDAEPLARAAIQRQIDLWFKQGFKLVGPEKRFNEYITKRLRQIALVSGIATNEMIRQNVRNLLKFSNAFIIKVRNANLSGGVKKPGRPAPIAGLFPVTPLSMFPRYENGKLIRWVRILKDGTRIQEFDVNDVIHIKFDHESDFLFGKPRMLGAIEDVAALRRIEENIEMLLAKFLNPIFQLMVGTPEAPCKYYPNGTSELDAAKGMIQDMEQEGMIITSERHKMDVIGAFNQALDAEPYLKHFKTRLYTGLGTSAVDMGEGDTANRSTADNISQNLKDRVISDQGSFADQLQLHLFAELFAEHPDDLSVLNTFDKVSVKFFNVDLDNRIKYENHIVSLYNNNLINESEAREELGRQPYTEGERSKTRFNLVDIPIAVIGAGDEKWSGKIGSDVLATVQPALGNPNGEISTGTGGGAAAKKGGGKRVDPSGKPKTPAAREVGIKSQPTNQHGKNPGPTKRKSFVLDHELIGSRLADLTDALMLANSKDEVLEEINNRFPEQKDRNHILQVVSNAYDSCKSKSELRASLVASLLTIKDKFKNEDE